MAQNKKFHRDNLDNKYDTFEGTKQKQAENMNENNEIEEEDEEIIKKEKKIVRKQLLSKEDKTKSKLYAVNISSEPKIAYDYEAYMNYKQLYMEGYVRRDKDGNLYVE